MKILDPFVSSARYRIKQQRKRCQKSRALCWLLCNKKWWKQKRGSVCSRVTVWVRDLLMRYPLYKCTHLLKYSFFYEK